MKQRIVPIVAAIAFALVACQGNTAGGAPADGGKDAKYYTMTVTPVTLATGETGALRVVIAPKDGLKWNDEFPAKLFVKEPKSALVQFPKTEVKKGDAGIAIQKGQTTLELPLQAATPGEGTVAAKLHFSLCTETTCHIFRDRDVQAAVTVK